jgi:hypothetical protein
MLNHRVVGEFIVRFWSRARAARKLVDVQRGKFDHAKRPMESTLFLLDAELQCICAS